MKNKLFLIATLLLAAAHHSHCQAADDVSKKWNVEASALFYFIPDDFFVLPILKADKNKLHLETRYNYEDRNTFSLFAGYNFSGGKKLEYTITPMLGVATGLLDGVAPGLEADLSLGKFGFYTEMEYLIAFNDKYSSYYYNWSELTFAPKEWCWFGISGQRTRLYETSLEIQRGLTAGVSIKKWQIAGYLFNPFTEDGFGIISLGVAF